MLNVCFFSLNIKKSEVNINGKNIKLDKHDNKNIVWSVCHRIHKCAASNICLNDFCIKNSIGVNITVSI